MAKKAAPKTAAMKLLDSLREQHEKAEEAAAKPNATQVQKDAVLQLAAKIVEQSNIVGRERFVRIGNIRALKALSAIKGLSTLVASRGMIFTGADLDAIRQAINKETERMDTAFKNALLITPAAIKTEPKTILK